MRRTYAPILVSSYQTSDAIVIYVVVDVIDKDINYKLDVDVISWQSVSILNLRYSIMWWISSLHLQKNTRMNHFEITDLSNKGFTGVKVFDEKMDTVFKGTSPQETFLLLTVTGEDNSGKTAGHEIISPHLISLSLSIQLQSLWLPTGISLLTSLQWSYLMQL